MDEIAGYFPPVANPPSKAPLLTLLKQARAFGLGVMLTTQNPVDLDYKGLSNTGTWFIGRLQTERDKMRVLDGLEGAASTQGMKFDRRQMEQILAGLGQRVFLMNNVHDDAPAIFETRWVMSYLRGPLTRNQISQLTASTGTPYAAGGDVYKRQVLCVRLPEFRKFHSRKLVEACKIHPGRRGRQSFAESRAREISYWLLPWKSLQA